MNATIKVNYQQEQFQRWLGNVLRTSKREASVVAQKQFKAVIAKCFLLTPPMSDTSFAKGLRAAKTAIKRDTGKAFLPILDSLSLEKLAKRKIQIPSGGVSAALAWYKRQQRPSKKPYVDKRRPILKSQLEQVRAKLLEHVGVTAAGWSTAADALGVKYPAWVARLKSKNSGSYKFSTTDTKLKIEAKNTSNHSDSSYIQKVLNRAFGRQADAMRRQIIAALAKKKVDPSAIQWGQRS